MKQGKKLSRWVDLPAWAMWAVALVSFAGAAYCGTEALLSLSGHTLCHAETCEVVESFSLLSRPVLSLLAIVYFVFQGALALALWRKKVSLLPLLVLAASAALGAEAIFIGRQFVDYHTHCPFCLTVATFTILSATTIILVNKRFAVFSTIFGVAAALLLTPLSIEPLPLAAAKHIYRGTPTEEWVLIYAPECPHCHEVLSFCESLSDIDLKLCPKNKALPFLHMLGIKGVPVMVVNRGGEKRILVGSGLIVSYLKGEDEKHPLHGLISPGGICEENEKCEPLRDIF